MTDIVNTAIATPLADFFNSIPEGHALTELFGGFELCLTTTAYGEPVFAIVSQGVQVLDINSDNMLKHSLTNQQVANFVALNKLIDTATDVALDAMCLAVQESLGIPSGDFASIYFSGGSEVNMVRRVVGEYIQAELRQL